METPISKATLALFLRRAPYLDPGCPLFRAVSYMNFKCVGQYLKGAEHPGLRYSVRCACRAWHLQPSTMARTAQSEASGQLPRALGSRVQNLLAQQVEEMRRRAKILTPRAVDARLLKNSAHLCTEWNF